MIHWRSSVYAAATADSTVWYWKDRQLSGPVLPWHSTIQDTNEHYHSRGP